MKSIISALIILMFGQSVFAQALEGRYEGAVSRDGSVQLVNFNFYVEKEVQRGSYEIPEIGYFDVPIERIAMVNDTLHLKFYFGNFFCVISPEKNQITGISEKWNPKLRLHVKKAQEKNTPYTQQEISFNNGPIRLSGMLYQPRDGFDGKPKYVILVHGSGAQDRFAPYYISLGYQLSKAGIGVLLYDKRGTGKSSGNFESASMQDLADDAVAAYNYLKQELGENTDVGFLGTSQGGWIAPLAANLVEDCNFLVLNVGPAVSVFQQDLDRIKYTMKADGKDQKKIEIALSYTSVYFEYARDNSPETWSRLQQMAGEIMNEGLEAYVNIPEGKGDFHWWRNNNFDPQSALSNLNCRTLSLFGEYDPLVPPDTNLKKMQTYLMEAKVPFDIKVIPGVLHDMISFQGLNGDNWDWPQVYWEWRRQPEEFLETIVGFILKHP